ncbi:MAG: DUF3198 domain-containing protein [Candidatus Thermoplasmatota archaeon]|nr:DUF3198 domain-containing protein [Candidatus Thermoplasmatota archaeon]
MSLKTTLKKHEVLISVIILLLAAYIFLIGLFGTVLSDYSPGMFTKLNQAIGAWKWWLLVVGGLLLFIFSLILFFRYRNLKEFKDLYNTESKSKFRKNIAQIEKLAMKLGPEYEDKVIEKEEEYNIDR